MIMLGRASAPALDGVGATKADTSRARRDKAPKNISFLKVNGRFLKITVFLFSRRVNQCQEGVLEFQTLLRQGIQFYDDDNHIFEISSASLRNWNDGTME
jgi:hypothetical protein